MLKKLKLHNFRTFLNTEIDFTQRHLLIGKNNSGKSNLCAALRFLSKTAQGDLSEAALEVPGGAAEITNWALDSNTVELECTCELPYDGNRYEFVYCLHVMVDASDGPRGIGALDMRVVLETLLVFDHTHAVVPYHFRSDGTAVTTEQLCPDGESQSTDTRAPKNATMLSKLYESGESELPACFRQYLASFAYLALEPGAMRFASRGSAAQTQGLDTSGTNLSVALHQMKNFDERSYRRVLEHVRLLEPHLEAINFIAAPDQAPVPFVELHVRRRASWIGLSDGTLKCLGLAYAIEAVASRSDMSPGDASPPVVIEEPENGIYPGMLRRLFDLFEERAPNGQFIFTSHSPYFINLFDASRESVTLFRRNKERSEIVPIPPASDDPDRELLAEEYSMELLV